ncbi:MAG: hypothetical protein DMF90_22480 [Acidobacteria bacterium]|nr:MAG: hypothetical protein DMF90_22480 [Acidobacteriota bacterium]
MREPVAETGGMSWITSTLSQPAERVAPLVLGAMLIAAGIVLLLERAQKEGVHILWPLLLVVVGATRAAPTLFHQAVALTIVAAGVVTCRNPLSRLGR